MVSSPSPPRMVVNALVSEQPIVVVAALDGVVAGAAIHLVNARSPVDEVVVHTSAQQIIAAASGDGVVARASVDLVRARPRIDRVHSRAAADGVVASGTSERVVPRATLEDVAVVAAVDEVVAGASIDGVVSTATAHGVIAAAGSNRVVATEAHDHVVVGASGDVVVSGGAPHGRGEPIAFGGENGDRDRGGPARVAGAGLIGAVVVDRRCQTHLHATYPIVLTIGNEDVATAIEGDRGWHLQFRVDCGPAIAAEALSSRTSNGGDHSAAVDLAHGRTTEVRYVDEAVTRDCHVVGSRELRGGGGAAVAGIAADSGPGDRRDGAVGGNAAHPTIAVVGDVHIAVIVDPVRNVDVAAVVDGNAIWSGQLGLGGWPAIAGVAGEAISGDGRNDAVGIDLANLVSWKNRRCTSSPALLNARPLGDA
ncbi:hypothetical protein GQR58_029672 [Nymphon striatum]|nr:hypothetical protein GQR58_029672 [Nymphon striatum]KAG1648650.1 hypothetical protein GQR58_029672 [Nymphon striatum]